MQPGRLSIIAMIAIAAAAVAAAVVVVMLSVSADGKKDYDVRVSALLAEEGAGRYTGGIICSLRG
ncbi:hypothetical protein [Nitrososphaera sp.]|uniref:hypothetical protein n=1 Tax=Nitrososphaera sp. TaxID=1971748 RepID=UPI00307CE715